MQELLEKKVLKNNIRIIDLLFALAITVLSIYARVNFGEFRSGDYNNFLEHWMQFIKENGGIRALKYSFADYNIPYLFIMCILSYLPISTLSALKIISCFFDYLLAMIVALVVYQENKSVRVILTTMSLILFLPTVVLNSSAWAQCDVIYSFFCICSIYYLIKKDSLKTMLYFSIALTFKLQAIFILPILIIFTIKDIIKIKHYICVPITYLVSILPALIVGRPIKSLLSIYLNQATQYTSLTLNYPNIYTLIGEWNVEQLSKYGMVFTLIVIGILAYYAFDKIDGVNFDTIISLSLLTISICAFLLPHMHERYGYLLDILSVIYAVRNPKKCIYSIVMVLISLLAYGPFLFGYQPIPSYYIAIALLLCIIFIAKECMNNLVYQSNDSRKQD